MKILNTKWNWKKIPTIIIAIILALFIMVGNFFLGNVRYPLFDSIELIAWYEHITGNNNCDLFPWDKVLCVNVGMDKRMAAVKDEFGDTVGYTAITNRDKLLQFLSIISTANYRELFIDIRFPKYAEGLTASNFTLATDSCTDSKLFSLISRLPHTIVASHAGVVTSAPTISQQTAIADYGATIFTGFGRYELRQNTLPSVALRLYQDLEGKDISPNGYFPSDWILCHNTIFPKIPQCLTESMRIDEGGALQYNYPFLSSYLLKYNSPEELRTMVKDKVVIIGDFEEDLHTTYVGEIPGSLLPYIVYLKLQEGKHLVGLCDFSLLILFILLVYIRIRMRKPWFSYLPKIHCCRFSIPNSIVKILNNRFFQPFIAVYRWMKENNVVNFVLSFIGWGTFFFLLQILTWSIYDYSLMILLPTIVFAIIDEYKRYKNEFSKTVTKI